MSTFFSKSSLLQVLLGLSIVATIFAGGIAAHAQTTTTAPPFTVPKSAPTSTNKTYQGNTGCTYWYVDVSNEYYKCPFAAGATGYWHLTVGIDGSPGQDTYQTDATGKITSVNSQSVSGGALVTSVTNPTTGSTTYTTDASAGSPPSAVKPASCGLGDVGCYITNGIAGWIAQLLYWVLTIMAFLLGKIGVIFNWAIKITVFQFGLYFANSQGMLVAWGVLRDIGNIVILFGFIFIGVMMILDLHSFDARRTLPRLIIFAVLLNFSLFVGEAIIDVANVLSSQIYKQAGPVSTTTGSDTNLGIAGIIIQDTGLATTFSGKPDGNNTTQMVSYVGVIIFIVVTMMVLLAGAIMLFTRAVMLSILLILSPIAFAGMAIPQLEGRAKEWWQKLIANAFFAPVYLLLIFVGIKVMEASKTALGGNVTGANSGLLAALQSNSTDSASIFILFAMMIAFMIAALMFAKSSGAAGAEFATNFAQTAIQRTVINPLRATAMAPVRGLQLGTREVVGGGAKKFATSYDTWMGQARTGKKGGFAKATALTLRGIGADEAIEHKLQGAQKAKYGTNRSYEDDKKHIRERTKHLEHAEHLAHFWDMLKSKDPAQQREALQGMSQPDIEQYLRENKDADLAGIAQNISAEKFNKLIESKDLLADQITELKKQRTAVLKELLSGKKTTEEVEREIQKTSQAELERYLKDNADDTAGIQRMAAALSTDKLDKLAESPNIDTGTLRALTDAHYNPILQAISDANAALKVGDNAKFEAAKKVVQGYSGDGLKSFAKNRPEDLSRLVSVIKDPWELADADGSGLLSDDQFNAIKDDRNLVRTQREFIKANTKGAFLGQALDDTKGKFNPEVAARIAKSFGTGLADQPNGVLTNPIVIRTFDKAVLQNLGTKNKLKSEERNNIMKVLRDGGPSANPNYEEINKWLQDNQRAREIWGEPFTPKPAPEKK